MKLLPKHREALEEKIKSLEAECCNYLNLDTSTMVQTRYKGRFTGSWKLTDITALGDPDSLRDLADTIELLRTAEKQLTTK